MQHAARGGEKKYEAIRQQAFLKQGGSKHAHNRAGAHSRRNERWRRHVSRSAEAETALLDTKRRLLQGFYQQRGAHRPTQGLAHEPVKGFSGIAAD